MKTLLSCEFNMDTGCVELRYSDGSIISINCTAVEDEVANPSHHWDCERHDEKNEPYGNH